MHPAFSVIVFTVVAGLAQGLVVALAVLTLAGTAMAPDYLVNGLLLAFVLLVVGLVSSFFHLGRPERFWRTAMMWRTSWLSREVIALPAFTACVALWWWLARLGASDAHSLLAIAALGLAGVLWVCTAMIYACIRFIQEWAHPLTLVNYTLIGLASGVGLAAALAHWLGDAALALALAPWALGLTALASVTRTSALRRNATLRPASTLQSATGIRAPIVRQTSMGMSAGAFNTREFFHRAPVWFVLIRPGFLLLAFVLPVLLLWMAVSRQDPGLLTGAVLLQFVGVLGERWFFFAQAQHPQNLYYQVVS